MNLLRSGSPGIRTVRAKSPSLAVMCGVGIFGLDIETSPFLIDVVTSIITGNRPKANHKSIGSGALGRKTPRARETGLARFPLSFSSPLQFLPISTPVSASHFVPMSRGTPRIFAAYCSSNSGDADAITIGRSRGRSKNHCPSLARVRSSCQNSSASFSRLNRLAISPKSTLLNCVRLRLPSASSTDVPMNRGSPASTAG